VTGVESRGVMESKGVADLGLLGRSEVTQDEKVPRLCFGLCLTHQKHPQRLSAKVFSSRRFVRAHVFKAFVFRSPLRLW